MEIDVGSSSTYVNYISGDGQRVSHSPNAWTLQVLGARLNTSLSPINTLSAIASIHPSYTSRFLFSNRSLRCNTEIIVVLADNVLLVYSRLKRGGSCETAYGARAIYARAT